MAKFGLNLSDVRPEDMDGDRCDPGWYFATLEKEEVRDKDGAAVLTFKISGPLSKGKTVQKVMNDPSLAKTDEKAKSLAEYVRRVAMRMQLLTEADAGKPSIDVDFAKAVGKPFVIEMEPHSYENEKGQTVHTAQMSYIGMFPLDHDKIPVAVREALGMPLLPGQVATGTPKPEKAAKGKATPRLAASPAAASPAGKPRYDASDV